jgi:predicted acetyltransferase
MNAELRQLSIHDGRDIYDMLQELPKDENGFINGCNGISFEEYKQWLVKSHNTAKGTSLADWMVPQTVYWLYVDGQPVGIGKLRHYLTDRLREEGGHCGYAIRPACRSMGYGKLLLKLLIKKAVSLGIDRILITVQNHNIPSIKVALANGGVIEKVSEQRHYIWIDCSLHRRNAQHEEEK